MRGKYIGKYSEVYDSVRMGINDKYMAGYINRKLDK
jgi:hypothetical protein